IVVEEVVAIFRRGKIGESAGYRSLALHVLVRIGEVQLQTMRQLWRAHASLPTVDPGGGQGHGKEDIGIAQHVMIEVIGGAGVEVVYIEAPAAQGNGEPELVLLVALAAQGQKTEALGSGHIEQRPAHRQQRWRLVVAAVEGTQYPAQARQLNSRPQARVGGRFTEPAGKVRYPQSAVEGQPLGGLELVFHEGALQLPPNHGALAERSAGGRIADAEQSSVALGEPLHPG